MTADETRTACYKNFAHECLHVDGAETHLDLPVYLAGAARKDTRMLSTIVGEIRFRQNNSEVAFLFIKFRVDSEDRRLNDNQGSRKTHL
jgi:hypothetical protein